MKNLKKDLQGINKELKALSGKVEKMIAGIGKTEKPKAAEAKPVKKIAVKKVVAKKTAKLSATDTVLRIIKRSRKGVDIDKLKKKSGFEGQKLHSIVYVLKKQGKIKAEKKGFYVKA